MGRGLMQEPVVLMIDELSLGLAPVLAQQLFLTLKTLKKQGLTIVLVEQNVHLALALSDHTYVLAEGRVEIEGDSREVANMDEGAASLPGTVGRPCNHRPEVSGHSTGGRWGSCPSGGTHLSGTSNAAA